MGKITGVSIPLLRLELLPPPPPSASPQNVASRPPPHGTPRLPNYPIALRSTPFSPWNLVAPSERRRR